MLRQYQKQFVIHPNRFINSDAEFLADLNVFRRVPAAHAVVLKVCIEAFSEVLILARIADETGIEVDWGIDQRLVKRDEAVRHAAAAQEDFRNLALRFVDGAYA